MAGKKDGELILGRNQVAIQFSLILQSTYKTSVYIQDLSLRTRNGSTTGELGKCSRRRRARRPFLPASQDRRFALPKLQGSVRFRPRSPLLNKGGATRV